MASERTSQHRVPRHGLCVGCEFYQDGRCTNERINYDKVVVDARSRQCIELYGMDEPHEILAAMGGIEDGETVDGNG